MADSLRSRTPTPSIGAGQAFSTSTMGNDADKPLLGQVKGQYTSQDDLDLLVEAKKSKTRSDGELSFEEQWHIFKTTFLFNKKTNKVLGRTLSEWLYLVAFYVVFIVVIASFTLVFLLIFYVQVSVIQPRLSNKDSIMRDYSNSVPSPGMGIRPLPDFETTLITFQANKPETYKFYTDHMQSFLKSYQTINARDDIRRKECNPTNLPDKEVGCMFQPEMKLGICGKIDSQAALGYDDGTPCVLLKLNKMFGWIPDPITCTSETGDNRTSSCDGLTPDEMQWFANYGRPGVPLHLLFNGQNIPVTCQGRGPADQENLWGIRWEPAPMYGSFPAYFFPYYNQRGYLAPLVGAQFNVSRAVLLMIRCRAWAKNIPNQDEASKDGAVHFELMVD